MTPSLPQELSKTITDELKRHSNGCEIATEYFLRVVFDAVTAVIADEWAQLAVAVNELTRCSASPDADCFDVSAGLIESRATLDHIMKYRTRLLVEIFSSLACGESRVTCANFSKVVGFIKTLLAQSDALCVVDMFVQPQFFHLFWQNVLSFLQGLDPSATISVSMFTRPSGVAHLAEMLRTNMRRPRLLANIETYTGSAIAAPATPSISASVSAVPATSGLAATRPSNPIIPVTFTSVTDIRRSWLPVVAQ